MGRDETLDCEDFMTGCACLFPFCIPLRARAESYAHTASEMVQPMDIHADMERKLRM